MEANESIGRTWVFTWGSFWKWMDTLGNQNTGYGYQTAQDLNEDNVLTSKK